MLTASATKLIDRFEIGTPTLVQYDLKTHKIVRTIPWPNGEERENANIQFSPDGKLMYLFSDQDVLIYETDEVHAGRQVGAVEADRGGLRPARVRLERHPQRRARLLHRRSSTSQDPVQHRRIMGIGRVNLAAKTVDFYTLGPSSPVSFTMAPGRKIGYGLFQDIGRYEFWKFDLESRKLAGRTEFTGRPRMSLKTSSNGKVLYIYNAGNTIDLYDAETYQYMRTITLDGDMTTELFVLPTPPAPATVPSSSESRRVVDRDLRRAIDLDRSVLAPSAAGAGVEPRQHRRCRCTCRCSRATSSTARCSAATPAASCASSAALRR